MPDTYMKKGALADVARATWEALAEYPNLQRAAVQKFIDVGAPVKLESDPIVKEEIDMPTEGDF